MAGVYGEINSRTDFFAILGDAIQKGKDLRAKDPANETIVAILRQLEAIATWTANGRTPTAAERSSTDFTLRAAREFEGDREKYGWSQSLYALGSYFEDWPSDEKATSATDADFFDSDEDEDDQ